MIGLFRFSCLCCNTKFLLPSFSTILSDKLNCFCAGKFFCNKSFKVLWALDIPDLLAVTLSFNELNLSPWPNCCCKVCKAKFNAKNPALADCKSCANSLETSSNFEKEENKLGAIREAPATPIPAPLLLIPLTPTPGKNLLAKPTP